LAGWVVVWTVLSWMKVNPTQLWDWKDEFYRWLFKTVLDDQTIKLKVESFKCRSTLSSLDDSLPWICSTRGGEILPSCISIPPVSQPKRLALISTARHWRDSLLIRHKVLWIRLPKPLSLLNELIWTACCWCFGPLPSRNRDVRDKLR
jgi:hypothetical protein